ncbi:hypothetical protein B0T25DRAFT_220887 [Lasiosphaeria hispida]|uniref:Uncharacterized protein n=1 Tax=Lasiosphaeria hispida TaxID=260671 RepID=A0AAJ0MER5_9PEZI|nr:hypothetical protein B0T25DRAFT_220887 [Lasiosphaeria hispida]
MAETTALPPRPPPFAIIARDITPTPLLTHIKDEKTFNHLGDFDTHRLASDAATYMAANSDGTFAGLHQTLLTFLTLAATDTVALAAPPDKPLITQACWLTARMWQPDDAFATPRWHRDGRMFTCSCTGEADARVPHAKYAVVLLGLPTLLLQPSAAADGLGRLGRRERAELAAALDDFPRVSVAAGDVIRFSWGQKDAPVHSEPDVSVGDRVFVSVLFGSETEIRDMAEVRGQKPEDWGSWPKA